MPGRRGGEMVFCSQNGLPQPFPETPRCCGSPYPPRVEADPDDSKDAAAACVYERWDSGHRNGSRLSVPRPHTSSAAAPGRTATSRASTPAFAMSCSTIFYTLREAQIVIESWRRHYNTIRPHASIGYKPPAPEVFVPAFAAWPAALRRPAPPATLAQPPTLN
jgi:hypothetical protein